MTAKRGTTVETRRSAGERAWKKGGRRTKKKEVVRVGAPVVL